MHIGQETETLWDSEDFSKPIRFDAWQHILNETYGSWDIDTAYSREFSALLETKYFGSMSVTTCTCDPCSATRTAKNIAKNNSETLVLQLVLQGAEFMTYDNNVYELAPGDLFIWDNTKAMKFDVRKRLEKISVMLPLSRLKCWLPYSWSEIPRKIPTDTFGGKLLKSHLITMSNSKPPSSPSEYESLPEATIALLVSTIRHSFEMSEGFSLKQAQLTEVKKFIKQHLSDPDLSLQLIAKSKKISIRYLHWLFSSEEVTASQFIIQSRLERCRLDLQNESMAKRSVSEIAYSWGFNDPSHFSKRYKDAFGISPTDTKEITLSLRD
jgi:AraC-like DNA-binding protein